MRQGKSLPPQVVLRRLFEKLGATYIKVGQFIASSPTLFPKPYVEEFQKCLDKTDPVPWKVISRTIEEELKQPINSVFSSVNPVPLATASVAQVHTAVLRESQKEVVLKVLKPGVEDILATDLNFLLISSKLLEVLNPDLARTSLAGIVSDIRSSMLDEVDFRKEVQHIQQFSAYLDRSGMRQGATCPFVYKHLSSKRYRLLLLHAVLAASYIICICHSLHVTTAAAHTYCYLTCSWRQTQDSRQGKFLLAAPPVRSWQADYTDHHCALLPACNVSVTIFQHVLVLHAQQVSNSLFNSPVFSSRPSSIAHAQSLTITAMHDIDILLGAAGS